MIVLLCFNKILVLSLIYNAYIFIQYCNAFKSNLDFEEDADHVYLLMNRNCCVSCNFRASWFFKHNNKAVAPHTAETDLL